MQIIQQKYMITSPETASPDNFTLTASQFEIINPQKVC